MTSSAADSEQALSVIPRWLLCLLIVALVHATAMVMLRTMHPAPPPPVATPPAVLLDLAPPAAPPPAPAPPVQQPAPTPPPMPVQPPPPPVPQPVEPPTPPPIPTPKPEAELPQPPIHHHREHDEHPRPHAQSPPREAPVTPVQAPPAPAPVAPAPAFSAQASASWESAVSARLAEFKRYPMMAQRHGEEGIAVIRFRVDHHGHVHSVTLIRGSGHADLDREAQALVDRAEPLPQPPADRTEDQIDLQLPIRFSLR